MEELGQSLDVLGLQLALAREDLGHDGFVPNTGITAEAIAQALQVDIHYFINPPPSSQVVRRAKEPELLETATPIRWIYKNVEHRIHSDAI